MAINRDSNGYTFGFAIALVVVVGTILASLSLGLADIKKANAEKKKKMDILSAIGIESTRGTVDDIYGKTVLNSFVVDATGNVIDGEKAFGVDVKKQYRDKTIDQANRKYPVFEAKNAEGEMITILPVVGAGLWGPIWGYIAIGEDNQTIAGAAFDHKGETPGLGAEIKQSFFEDRWVGEKISENNQFTSIKVVKDGSGVVEQKVDGITGGTITSVGVGEMMNRTMAVYVKYFNNKK